MHTLRELSLRKHEMLKIEENLLYWLNQTRMEPGLPIHSIALTMATALHREEVAILINELKSLQDVEDGEDNKKPVLPF